MNQQVSGNKIKVLTKMLKTLVVWLKIIAFPQLDKQQLCGNVLTV